MFQSCLKVSNIGSSIPKRNGGHALSTVRVLKRNTLGSLSSGAIVDPFTFTPSSEIPSIFSLDGLGYRKKRFIDFLKSTGAVNTIRTHIPDFEATTFGRHAEDIFFALNASIISRNKLELGKVATPELRDILLKSKSKQGVSFHVLGYLSRSKVVQLRLLKLDPKDDRIFAQVSVMINSIRTIVQYDTKGVALPLQSKFKEIEEILADNRDASIPEKYLNNTDLIDKMTVAILEAPLFGSSRAWRLCHLADYDKSKVNHTDQVP